MYPPYQHQFPMYPPPYQPYQPNGGYPTNPNRNFQQNGGYPVRYPRGSTPPPYRPRTPPPGLPPPGLPPPSDNPHQSARRMTEVEFDQLAQPGENDK
jgi:hypothetical protein